MSKAESVLKHLYDKVVDVIHETFTTKYYIVGISQAKNGNIYLIIRKKKAGCLVKNKFVFTKRLKRLLRSLFHGTRKKSYLSRNYFIDFKLIRRCSGYHFHVLFICRDKYVNRLFWSQTTWSYLFLPTHSYSLPESIWHWQKSLFLHLPF